MDGSSYHTLLYPRTNGSFTPSLGILKGTKKAIMVLPEVMTVQRGRLLYETGTESTGDNRCVTR